MTASVSLAERWVAIVDDVLLGLPARAILVGLDPKAPDGLEASTSAVCAPSGNGEPAVCSERITLRAGGAVCSRLARCIGALCATDVPMTLVWPGAVLPDDPSFRAIACDADRIVLAGEDDGEPELAGLANLMALFAPSVDRSGAAGTRRGPAIADLAWTRLAPWQECCARMFDGPMQPIAGAVTRIELAQAGLPGMNLGSEGALLLGWLATRLEWQARSSAGKLCFFRPDGGQVLVVLRADAVATARCGALVSAQIDASGRELAMRGGLVRETGEADSARWHLDVTSRGETHRIDQHVRLRGSGQARLLERTLHRPLHDDALTESVAWVAALGTGALACT